MGRIKAVVFDWAGTMVDFGSFATVEAIVASFAEFGVAVTVSDARKAMGLNRVDQIAAMLAEPQIAARWQARLGTAPDQAAIARLHAACVRIGADRAQDHATLVPGAQATLDWLGTRGIRLGATTGAPRAVMERVLPRAAAQGYAPETLVCADDLAEGRPGPLMLYRCFVDLAVHPPQAVIKVDDTAPGIAEGVAAGCITVGVALSGNAAGLSVAELADLSESDRNAIRRRARTMLKAAGADHVIDTVADLPSLIETLEL